MIEELKAYLINQLNNNDIFVGVLGGSLAASVIYYAKSAIPKTYEHAQSFLTSTIEINSTDYRFKSFLEYFQTEKPILRRSKFSLIKQTDDPNDYVNSSDKHKSYKLGIGYGTHFYRINKKLISVNYYIDDSNKSMKLVERLKIKILSRKPQKHIEVLLSKVKDINNEDNLVLRINSKDWWDEAEGVQKRTMDSIFIEPDIKKSIINSIDKFKSNKDFCLSKGIQWKKSLMFDGPAGTGKSSLCMAIASKYNMPLYYLNLGAVENDQDLQSLFSQVPKESVILIEDVDCAKRDDTKSNSKNKGITTSCLLNCLDGALTPSGRLLLMTTNHFEKLDPALVRTGRVDHRFKIDKMSLSVAKEMVSYLRPELKINEEDLIGKTGAEIELMLKEK